MNKDNTNVDLHPVSQLEGPADDVKLDPYLLDLLWNEPFFSSVLRKVTKVRTNEIPTAGVSATDGNLRLWWNPKFVGALEPAKVRGLLKHECWHIILDHTTTRRHEPHLLWNYATDWAINSMIPENELPEGGLRPGRPFDELTEEQLSQMTSEQIDRHAKLSNFQANLPLEKSSEWYFAELLDNEEIKKALEKNEKEQNESGNPTPGMPGGMDDHEGWDDLTDEERELVKGKVKQALEEAVKEADSKARGWGTMTAEGRKLIRELISNEIPWQSVLKKFCGMTRRANRASNVKRLNRKYPGIHPGAQKGYTSSIAVYIDQSGSVCDQALEQLFGELRSLAKRTEFVVYHFDTSVDESSETTWRKGKTPRAHRTRFGVTSFKAPTEHANKNSHRFDGYLILTDGEAPDPGPTKLKRGWVIVPDRKLVFDASKRDFVIAMKGN